MKLSNLIENLNGLSDREISGVTDDSRRVTSGCAFVCIRGQRFDGHTLAEQALDQGASLIVAERDLGLGDRQLIVPDTRKAYGQLCAAWFGHPEKKLKLIGVTGTNGKTTTVNVIKHILTKNGHKVGLIGTICNEIGDQIVPAKNTTPLTFELFSLFSKMVEAGCDMAVMEVSSFGLVQNRIGPANFEIGVFTNLTPEHLDYHRDMEDYYQAKRMLFDVCDLAVCNIDDTYGQRLYSELSCQKYSYGTQDNADFYADVIKLRPAETSFWFCHEGKSYRVNMKMTGMFNVSNVTAAMGACLKCGLSMDQILEAVAEYSGVRGRCEVIPTGREFSVICDYAHTPDALEKILSNLRACQEERGRLVCLFGCGGDRDATKRPLMGAAAAQYADHLILTSDNPRSENPDAIIAEIQKGIPEGTSYTVVADRIQAIHHAIQTAQPGDVIVLAGKGHEDYQILADQVTVHLDEREIVADALRCLNQE